MQAAAAALQALIQAAFALPDGHPDTQLAWAIAHADRHCALIVEGEAEAAAAGELIEATRGMTAAANPALASFCITARRE